MFNKFKNRSISEDMQYILFSYLVILLVVGESDAVRADSYDDKLKELAQIHAGLVAKVKDISDNAQIVDNCSKVFGSISSGQLADDAQVKACKVAESANDFNPRPLEEKIDRVFKELTTAAEKAKTAATALLQETTSGTQPTGMRTPTNTDQLRLVSITAGDHSTGHICKGNEPLQRLVKLCFTMQSNGTSTETVFKPGKQINCIVPANMFTVAKICGYRPSPQGLNSIRVTYACGNNPAGNDREFRARTGSELSITCDEKAYVLSNNIPEDAER